MVDKFMAEAIAEAKAGMAEGNTPIGSVFVKDGKILGRGRNTLMRTSDPTAHAEMEAYRDAAQTIAKTCKPDEVQNMLAGGIVYTTMMPCPMCAGAIIRFGATAVIVAETQSYSDSGTKPFMERQGVDVTVLDATTPESEECVSMMSDYYDRNPERRSAMTSTIRPPLKL